MELEKFRDQAVNQSLFRMQSPDDVPMSLLKHWDSNENQNDAMAKFIIIIDGLIKGYPQTLQDRLGGFTTRLPILLAGIDDHRATMAVEALGKATLIGQQPINQEKKGGLFGMMTKKDKDNA